MILSFLFPLDCFESPQSQFAGCQSDVTMGSVVDEEKEKWIERVFLREKQARTSTRETSTSGLNELKRLFID